MSYKSKTELEKYPYRYRHWHRKNIVDLELQLIIYLEKREDEIKEIVLANDRIYLRLRDHNQLSYTDNLRLT